MTTILLKLNDMQESELKEFMKEEGYSNKTEFIRFLIKFYKYNRSSAGADRFEKAVDSLKGVLIDLNKKGKLDKTLEEQLDDI